jgi:hypothetical protein
VVGELDVLGLEVGGGITFVTTTTDVMTATLEGVTLDCGGAMNEEAVDE